MNKIFFKLLGSSLSFLLFTTAAQSSNFQGFSTAIGISTLGANLRLATHTTSGVDWSTFGNNVMMENIDVSFAKDISQSGLIGFGVTHDLHATRLVEVRSFDNLEFIPKSRNHRSLYLQPTYLFDDTTAFFAKIAYHFAQLHLYDNAEIAGIPGSFSRSMKNSGFGYGVGIKKLLSSNLFLQAEVQAVSFGQRKKGHHYDANYDSYEVKVTLNSGTISLGYTF